MTMKLRTCVCKMDWLNYLDMPQNWVEVQGYSEYEVSDKGEVRNKMTQRTLKCSMNADGCYRVGLVKNSKQQSVLVHRLVAQAFVDNPHGKPMVSHIDGNRANNISTNLRWATKSEIQMSAIKPTNASTSKYKGVYFDKHTCKWRSQYKLEGKPYSIGLHKTEEEAAQAYNDKVKDIYKSFAKLNVIEQLTKPELASEGETAD